MDRWVVHLNVLGIIPLFCFPLSPGVAVGLSEVILISYWMSCPFFFFFLLQCFWTFLVRCFFPFIVFPPHPITKDTMECPNLEVQVFPFWGAVVFCLVVLLPSFSIFWSFGATVSWMLLLNWLIFVYLLLSFDLFLPLFLRHFLSYLPVLIFESLY